MIVFRDRSPASFQSAARVVLVAAGGFASLRSAAGWANAGRGHVAARSVTYAVSVEKAIGIEVNSEPETDDNSKDDSSPEKQPEQKPKLNEININVMSFIANNEIHLTMNAK